MADRTTSSHRARRLGWLALGAAAIAIALIWAASRLIWSGKIEPGLLAQRIAPLPNRAVSVAVRSQSFPIRREVIGSIQSRVPVTAASRVAARVTEVKVRAGDRVRRGQVIVVLDASELKAQVAQAQGELAAARAELGRASADEKRFTALLKRGSVTASEHDAAEAGARGAAGRVAQAQAAIAAARAGLAYATVRSPLDGVVVERLAEPGDMAMPGKPLVRLYDANQLRVELEVPEDLARAIETGTALEVSVAATGAVYQTQVSEVVPAADPASRSFRVRAPLPVGQHLRPGMFARATFRLGHEMVLTVPRGAVEEVGQLQTVRVLSQGRIQRRMVSLGRSFDDRVEVLAGVREGERVIIGNLGAADK